MVKVINDALTGNIAMQRRPLIVELVGPAGAGKTTLAQALNQRSRRILIETPPFYRRMEHIPFFTRNIVKLIPTIFHMYRNSNGRWLTREEMAWLVILTGWHQALRQNRLRNDAFVVLDQGPIFMLAQLYGLSSESFRIQGAEKWWDGAINRWSTTLDAVVWLDASDAILVERIRTRNKWHLAKGKSEQEVFEFLASYRTAYEQVISMFTANNNCLKILRYDTAQEPLGEIVNKVLVVFDLEDSEDRVAC